jgi:hypothetical protein
MRHRLLALALSGMAFGAWAGPAMADDPVNGQTAEQVAGNVQHADSSATSTQYQPTNQNISVRVLSPGNGGAVTQSNDSAAQSYAGNGNETEQAIEQSQSGSGGTGIQEAAQKAGSEQQASSEATSTQVKPTNQNISVRVLSPGNDGAVTQTNSSTAKSGAENGNETKQTVDQSQGSDGLMYNTGKEHPKCGCDSTGIQAAGQEAYNKQKAESSAESTQVKAKNQNIAVRVLSPGDDGAVKQSNDSTALSKALNHNSTTQDIDQSQGASGCGCHGGTAIQAAGQAAFNWQKAESAAESKQIEPENKALSFRFKSYGGGGGVTQSNASMAESYAANWNELEQRLQQLQGAA